MKKIILVIYDNNSIKNRLEREIPCQNECKLIIIDSETDKEDLEIPVITLKTNSCNKLDHELVDELLCSENQIYILLTGSDDPLPGQKILPGKTVLLKEDSFAVKYSLTQQEMLVMDNLMRGLPYKEIADKLCISYHTVKNHLSNIYIKLEVNNRSAAVYMYFDHKYSLN